MILLVDKPAGMTSQKVVAKIKHASVHKLKIGHTGTLDPMCTGLLSVLTDRDTKLTQYFPHRKSYLASVRFGLKTDTGDVTGETLETSDLPTEDQFREVLPKMVGPCLQIPPMYSAVHVEGKRLYELARMGVEVKREPRQIEIFDLAYVDRLAEDEFRFSVTCSTGTYIRTLCEDIAAKMGLCATMSALRRIQSNGFALSDAHSLDEVLSLAEQDRLREIAVPTESAFSHLPAVTVPESGRRYYLNGGLLTLNRLSPVPDSVGLYRAYAEDGRFIGLLEVKDGVSKSVFSSD